MVYKEEINNIKNRLAERRINLKKELADLPEGELMIIEQDGIKKYLQRITATGNKKKERRYGIKRKPDILNGLVRKKYVLKALEVLDKDISIMERTERWYKETDENSVMNSFVEKNPELSQAIYSNSVIDEAEWKRHAGRIEHYHPENLKQIAADGTKMRSKNEVYIASRLDHHNLLYRSDCQTGIKGLYYTPDFTIVRKRDGKIVYWEHLGMMDDNDYRKDNKLKIEEYEKHGIVPWDNLILTYDSPGGGLRADLIEAMIIGWLL